MLTVQQMVDQTKDKLRDRLETKHWPLQEHRSLNNEVRKFYFGGAAINEQTIPQYYDYLCDVNFVYGIDKSVRTSAIKSKGKAFYSWWGFYFFVFLKKFQKLSTLIFACNGKCFFRFLRRFSVDSTLNVFKHLNIFNPVEMIKLPGASHGDDVCYLFR